MDKRFRPISCMNSKSADDLTPGRFTQITQAHAHCHGRKPASKNETLQAGVSRDRLMQRSAARSYKIESYQRMNNGR